MEKNEEKAKKGSMIGKKMYQVYEHRIQLLEKASPKINIDFSSDDDVPNEDTTEEIVISVYRGFKNARGKLVSKEK